MSAFTDADVRLVALAVNDVRDDTPDEVARRVLTALADAGRLTPADRDIKVTQIWYRSLQADGSVWCESSNGREVVQLSEGVAERFERYVVTEVKGSWEPWVAVDGTP